MLKQRHKWEKTMSNGLASSAGAGPSQPKEQPALDQIYGHINANNELVRSLTADVRTFVSRAIGRNIGDPPSADAPSPEGSVNLIAGVLSTQSQCLQELRDAVNVLPEIT